MRRHPLYLAFGILVVGGFAFADSRGWILGSSTEGRAGPRTVRDNPGSSRSVYIGGSSSGRYRGGK